MGKPRSLWLAAALLLSPASQFLDAAPPADKHAEDKNSKGGSKTKGDPISKSTLAGRVNEEGSKGSSELSTPIKLEARPPSNPPVNAIHPEIKKAAPKAKTTTKRSTGEPRKP